jgi:hypothetical protein
MMDSSLLRQSRLTDARGQNRTRPASNGLINYQEAGRRKQFNCAGVAELVDAYDRGS